MRPSSKFLLCDLSLGAGKKRKNLPVMGGFRNDLTGSQADFCKQFQCQIRRFRFFDAGYWKDF
jgi:hypothetical protein